MEDVVVGIDLGTTNSCVAAIIDGRPKIIEDERGYNILPSCVAFRSKGKFVVGHGAKALILTNPDQTVYAAKRLIGRKFSSPEIQEAVNRLSYQVFEGVNDEVLLRLGEVELTPVEVSSVVIKCIKEVAERALDTAVQRAVVTVPAYFNNAQRMHTKEAVELAGLECMRLVNEPTAAALAYGFKKDLEKKIAIYDLGGGTFDISVLDIAGGVYETLGTSGNSYLGGEDFDYRVVDHLAEQFLADHGVDLREDRMSMQRLKDAAERAKCELSFVDKTPVLIPRVHENFNLEMTLTRDVLESLADDLIRETVRITSEALNEANVSIDELDEIILVGGMTRMPKVQEAIRVFFGMAPCKGVHPEEVVAIGAAVQAFSLENEAESHLLLDVTPFSLGIDTAGGFFGKVIDRNSTIPINQSRNFTTVNDNQDEVKIVVRQGESGMADENEFLGEFTLEGIRPAPRMVPRVEVSFKIDVNGILNVSAVDRDTGEKQTVKIRDYIDRAAPQDSSTEIQLAANSDEVVLSAAKGKADPGAGGAAPGVFGKLKGMFGGKDKGKAAPADSTDVADKDGSGTKAASTEVADKSQPLPEQPAAEPVTELADKSQPIPDVAAPEPVTEMADRDLGPDLIPDDSGPIAMGGEDSGIAQELRESLSSLFEEDAIPAPAASVDDEPTLESGVPIPTDSFDDSDALTTPPGGSLPSSQAMVPVDEVPTADGETPLALGGAGPEDPFGIQERPELDPFGGSSGDDDPFSVGGGGLASDPFTTTGMEHSKRTRKVDTQLQTKPDITPATFNLTDDPDAAAAARKKPAKLKIRYKKARTFAKEFRDNLERGGTYIKTPKPLERGRRCVFELTVPGRDEPIRLRGAVVWSSRGMDELPDGKVPGMAIDYDPDDTAGLDAVREAVEQSG